MRVFGLTGGIASGKSTVGKMFRALGAPVIDADLIARQVVEPGQPALAELATAFGPEILDATGALDRKRLAAIAFSDPEKRKRLNAITHPRIAAATADEMAELARAGHPVAIYEAALLVENGVHHGLAGLIVVSVDEATQEKRLAERDGLDETQIRQRIFAQLPLAQKLAVATHVIDNNGTPDETRAQVEKVWREINEVSPKETA